MRVEGREAAIFRLVVAWVYRGRVCVCTLFRKGQRVELDKRAGPAGPGRRAGPLILHAGLKRVQTHTLTICTEAKINWKMATNWP